jgi:hypothetical protein
MSMSVDYNTPGLSGIRSKPGEVSVRVDDERCLSMEKSWSFGLNYNGLVCRGSRNPDWTGSRMTSNLSFSRHYRFRHITMAEIVSLHMG